MEKVYYCPVCQSDRRAIVAGSRLSASPAERKCERGSFEDRPVDFVHAITLRIRVLLAFNNMVRVGRVKRDDVRIGNEAEEFYIALLTHEVERTEIGRGISLSLA